MIDRRQALVLIASLFGSGTVVSPAEMKYKQKGPCGKPPAPKPSRIKGAETYPPLPLPATPLRRTEKKRPPRPSALIGKIAYGSEQHWMTDPGDLRGLLGWINPKLSLNYGHRTLKLNDSRLRTVPILYMTGHNYFQVEKDWPILLRRYLEDGGTVIVEACCGRIPFIESFLKIYPSIFPDKPLRPLPSGHPAFWCYYDLPEVEMMEEGETLTTEPVLYGTDIGCRTALYFSKADLSCGWDHHTHPEGTRNMPEDAMKLGMNMVTYALACRKYAEEYAAQDRLTSQKGDVVIGHLFHNGDWNPNPYAVSKLLSEFIAQFGSEMRIQAQPIRITKENLARFPFVYMTGHYSFEFNEEERKALSSYLKGGGFLLANNCCGREEFDLSFRREIAKIIPETGLKPISTSSPLFRVPFQVERVSYVLDNVQASRPVAEAISIQDNLTALYYRYGLENGRAGLEYPFGRSVVQNDSLKLGVNTLVYAMSH